MKIGILTHYEVNNQGAQLQMYALSTFLRSLGHETVILTYEKNFDLMPEEGLKNNVSLKSVPYYLKNYLINKGIGLFVHNALKYEKLKAFRNKNFVYEPYDSDDLDAVIVGSDEVFSIDVGINPMMYGIGLNAKRVIAYAPAFGKATISDLKANNCYEMIRDGLSAFTALSARDTHTREMILEMTGRGVPIVCDPVIMMDFDQIPKGKRKIRKPYLLVYSYDANMKNPDEYKAIQAFAKRHHLLCVSAGTYHEWCDINVTCDPIEWIDYFLDAEFVITDTFHGFVTALKTKRPFAVYVRNTISPYKMRSLLEQTDTADREFCEFTFSALEMVSSKQIDFDQIDIKINDLKKAGEDYLRSTLCEDFSSSNISSAYKDTWCSGCAACAAICPAGAIELSRNTAGYYEAHVDEDKCIHCGRCISVCGRFQKQCGRSLFEAAPYALQSSCQQTVLSSSSGGIASEIAREALKNGDKMAGCRYNCETQEAEHICIDEHSLLEMLKGSKYLQSNAQTAFKDMIRDMQKNSDVHYTVFGTPCQISGISRIAEILNIRDRLLLVEIFCHGVPTYKLWDHQLSMIKDELGNLPDSVQFRNKRYGWHTYCLNAEYDGKEWIGSRENTEFWLSYFEDGLLNRSCMVCKDRGAESLADIRLGDYWGARYVGRTDGVSAVLCMTDKGKAAIVELLTAGSVIELECGPVEEILSMQNMSGYTIGDYYLLAQEKLEEGTDIQNVIHVYHKNMPLKKKLKRTALKLSGQMPRELVQKIRTIKTR